MFNMKAKQRHHDHGDPRSNHYHSVEHHRKLPKILFEGAFLTLSAYILIFEGIIIYCSFTHLLLLLAL